MMDPFFIAIILYVLAVVLAFVDLFIPSGGILIILGALSAVGSVLFAFQSGYNFGLLALAVVLASVPGFAFAAISIWPRTPIGKRVILGTPARREDEKHPEANLRSLIGVVIETESALMPSGHLRIGTRRYNARTQSGIIEAGQRVEIVGVQARELIVSPTSKPLTKLTSQPDRDSSSLRDGQDSDSSRNEDESQNLLDRPAEELGLDSLD